MSSAVYDALPGVPTPVADVRRALAAMWDVEPEAGDARPPASEFRASQMNLVVHFGLDSTPEQARRGFDTAMAFSRRYPCRIIALCPQAPDGGGDVAAKIACECFLGESGRDMACTEAIMLTYPLEQRAYLENQASIMLEGDLPIFYWPQRINSASRLADYKFFLKEAQRIVIDTAVERPAVPAFAWPRPEIVHDLAFARVLPVRQHIGHFLSYVAPARLVQGLERVDLRHRPEFSAEARALLDWMRRGVAECAKQATPAIGNNAGLATECGIENDAGLAGSLAAEWRYADGARLRFDFDFAHGTACLVSTLDCEPNEVGTTARLLVPENALAEALFF